MREKDIRRYLFDEMSQDERAQFDQELRNNTDLRSELNEFRETRDAVRMHERKALKKQLVQLEELQKSKNRRFPIAFAASILVLIGIGSFFYFNRTAEATETVYMAYYEPYPNVHAPITRDADSLSDLEAAFANYENEKYTLAERQFNSILKQDDNADVRFYLAITYIELKQLGKAEKTLKMIEPNQTRYYPQVLWYGALLDLKKGKNASAKRKLKALKMLDSGYKKKGTEELIKQL